MYDFRECVVHLGESAVAKHLCECRSSLHFEERLDLVERLAVGRITDSETIEGESAEFVLVGCNVDVGVVEVVVGKIPVTTICELLFRL